MTAKSSVFLIEHSITSKVRLHKIFLFRDRYSYFRLVAVMIVNDSMMVCMVIKRYIRH
jgi:hypothetical protein